MEITKNLLSYPVPIATRDSSIEPSHFVKGPKKGDFWQIKTGGKVIGILKKLTGFQGGSLNVKLHTGQSDENIDGLAILQFRLNNKSKLEFLASEKDSIIQTYSQAWLAADKYDFSAYHIYIDDSHQINLSKHQAKTTQNIGVADLR